MTWIIIVASVFSLVAMTVVILEVLEDKGSVMNASDRIRLDSGPDPNLGKPDANEINLSKAA